jgi:hypothetical protein
MMAKYTSSGSTGEFRGLSRNGLIVLPATILCSSTHDCRLPHARRFDQFGRQSCN